MLKKLVCSTLVAGGLVIGGCSSSDDDDDFVNDGPNPPLGEVDVNPVATPGVGNSVYDNIVNNSDLSTLRIAIDTAGLADALDNEENEFTVFAPNNAAFLQLDAIFLGALLADPSQLIPTLTFHVLEGTTSGAAAGAAIATGPAELETLNGANVTVSSSDSSPSGLAVGGADIIAPDSDFVQGTSVGVVHIIDSVLSP